MGDLGGFVEKAFPVPYLANKLVVGLFTGNDGGGASGEKPPGPPPPPPDLTDEMVQKARAAMVRRAMMGQGLGSNFLTGSLGDLSAVPTYTPTLGGR